MAPKSHSGFGAIRETDGKILSFKGMNGANETNELTNLSDNLTLALKKYKDKAHDLLPENMKDLIKCEIWVSGEHASGANILEQWNLIKDANVFIHDYPMVDKIFYIAPDGGIFRLDF